MKKIISTFLVASMLTCNGCVLVPVIESVSQIGVTKSDREALLSRDMKKLNDAIYWGKPEEAAQLFSDETRATLIEGLRKKNKEERVVESKVDSVEFNEDSYAATVAVSIRYYTAPYYVVTERIEEQQWQFKLPSGWRILSREVREG
jgi:hypothetical protein